MRLSIIGASIFGLGLALFVAPSCTSSSNSNNSSGGNSGNSGGSGGSSSGSGGSSSAQGGSAGGGSGGGTAFTALSPCNTADMYETTPTKITFSTDTLMYAPKCLKVTKGTVVTFSGDFASHPLAPTNDTANNPITATSTGSADTPFTFSKAGFFSYKCTIHGSIGMKGVVWVTE